MKKNLTTKKDFDHFKARCRHWLDTFGIKWEVAFKWADEEEKDSRAYVHYNVSQCMAMIGLAKDWGVMPIGPKELDKVALHEVLHMFLGPTIWSAERRDRDGVDKEEHLVIRTLENIFVK